MIEPPKLARHPVENAFARGLTLHTKPLLFALLCTGDASRILSNRDELLRCRLNSFAPSSYDCLRKQLFPSPFIVIACPRNSPPVAASP